MERYEYDKSSTIVYDPKNKETQSTKENLLLNDKNKYIKKCSYDRTNKRKFSFFHKEDDNNLFCRIKTNRTNNKYYNYQANKYSIHKNKYNSSSLKMPKGNNCLNIPIKTSKIFHN